MNRVELVGRVVRDIEVKKSQSGTSVARFTVACEKWNKEKQENEADFINCITFGNSADFLGTYVKKGFTISVEGRLQSGSYDDKNTGKKVYTLDVVADNVRNLTPKSDTQEYTTKVNNTACVSDDDLPF